MSAIDSTVKKETLYVAGVSLILSAVMQLVYILISKWNFAVLFGNLFGFLVAVFNFLLIGITVQKALNKTDKKEIKNFVKMSQSLRLIMLLIAAVLAYLLPCFDLIPVLISFLFPRLAVTLRGFTMKEEHLGTEEGSHEE